MTDSKQKQNETPADSHTICLTLFISHVRKVEMALPLSKNFIDSLTF